MARKAAAEDIDGLDVGCGEPLHVGMARHSWPMVGEHSLAEGVLLAEPGGAESTGPLEAEIEAADA